MSTYLLLRNNKESGPYALDDLVKSGLKAYDLVWIQGKSAAWRYPGEIDELKPYAPMVEEQPFDRFFKKDSSSSVQKEPPVVVAKKTSSRPDTNIEEEYQKYIPKKSVVVTLPQQKKVVVQMPVSKPVTAAPASISTPTPAPVPAATAIITVKENPATPKIKYYQTLDEIKEMYVKTLEERKGKITRKVFLTKNLKRAAVIAGLLTIGLLAGFIIKSGSGAKENVASQQTVPSVPVINNEQLQKPLQQELMQETPANDISANEETQRLTAAEEVNQPVKQKERPTSNTIVSKKETSPVSTEKKKGVAQEPLVAPERVEQDPATGERNSITRNENNSISSGSNDEPAIKAVKKNNWDKIVSITNNDYKRVAFGGIRNLELTVTNDSKYILDKVVVQVQYLKNSDAPVKTENVEFHSIAPNGGTQTLRMPDTNRGAKVSYKVINIEQLQPETASSGL